jgi:hypothetical protein
MTALAKHDHITGDDSSQSGNPTSAIGGTPPSQNQGGSSPLDRPEIGRTSIPAGLTVGPDAYAMGFKGPGFGDDILPGDMLFLDPAAPLNGGSYAAVYLKDQVGAGIYRLVLALPDWALSLSPKSEAIPALIVETVHGRTGSIPLEKVEAVHRVVRICRDVDQPRLPLALLSDGGRTA